MYVHLKKFRLELPMTRKYNFETLQLHAGQLLTQQRNHVPFRFIKQHLMFLKMLKKLKIYLA